MFVIVGATGKAGRMTVKQLRSQGAPVRAVVRKSSNAEDLSALGCEIAEADLNEAAAIKMAIRGADAVQVICPVQAQAENAARAMGKTIDAIASALTEIRPAKVLAISDYGAPTIRLDPDFDSSGCRPKLREIGFRSLCGA
jgi:NAD(P)H dehydrogenase (quinone)